MVNFLPNTIPTRQTLSIWAPYGGHKSTMFDPVTVDGDLVSAIRAKQLRERVTV